MLEIGNVGPKSESLSFQVALTTVGTASAARRASLARTGRVLRAWRRGEVAIGKLVVVLGTRSTRFPHSLVWLGGEKCIRHKDVGDFLDEIFGVETAPWQPQ
jgi:hypothetical protein